MPHAVFGCLTELACIKRLILPASAAFGLDYPSVRASTGVLLASVMVLAAGKADLDAVTRRGHISLSFTRNRQQPKIAGCMPLESPAAFVQNLLDRLFAWNPLMLSGRIGRFLVCFLSRAFGGCLLLLHVSASARNMSAPRQGS